MGHTGSDLGREQTGVKFYAWIGRNRRLDRDIERYATTFFSLTRIAMIRFVLKRLAAAKPFVIPQAESSSSERKPTEDDDPQPVISSNEHNMLENDAFERGNGAIVKWVLQADPDGAEPPQENVHRRSLTPEAPSVRACNVLTLSETIAKSEEFDEWLNARISHFKSDRPLSDPLP